MARRQLADLVGEELARPAPISTIAPAPAALPPTQVQLEVPAPAAPAAASAAPEPSPEPIRPPRKPAAAGPRPARSAAAADRLKRPPAEAADSREDELSDLPKYLRYVRKESRLREDQVLELERLVLKLNRRRGRGEGERITLNTLLRIGADLLIERQAELAGETEDELSRSLRS
jgi:hypothetical protein